MRFRQSEISAFDWCRRHHKFRYGMGLTPVYIGRRMPSQGQRDIGSAVHAGIEVFNNTGDLDAAEDAAVAYVETLRAMTPPGEEPPPLREDKPWWDVVRYATAMVANYVDWVGQGNEVGVQILGNEVEWEAELPNGITVFGKIDTVLRDPLLNNGLVVRDYKSVSTFSQTPQEADFQLRTYAWAAWKTYGEVPRRAEHLMMKRVLGTGGAKPPFFERYPIQITRWILERHEAHLMARTQEMANADRLTAYSPVIWPSASKDCDWRCEFKDICPLVDDGSDWEDVLHSQFQVAPSD